jgi:hypothetical protein
VKTSVALAAALLLATPLAASAQIQPIVSRFDVERFTPPPMAECSLVVGCGEAGAAGTFRVALAGFLELRPLVLREGSHVTGGGQFGNRELVGDVVRDRSGAALAGAYALRDGLEVHGTWYLVASQAGDDLSAQLIETPGAKGTGSPTVGVRWTTWSQARGAPVTGALRLDLVPPLGWPEALAGNPGWVLQPRFELADWTDTSVMTAELGGDLRSRTVQLGVDRLGNAFTWALAVAGRARPFHRVAPLQ